MTYVYICYTTKTYDGQIDWLYSVLRHIGNISATHWWYDGQKIKGKEFSPEEKRVVINISESGNPITEISRLLKRHHSTVSIFIRRYLLRGELENRRRSERPQKITPQNYRKLERLVKVNRRDTLSDITLKFNENNVNPDARRT